VEENKPGQHLLEELKWVHDRIRHDLRVCEDLARRVSEGLPQADVQAEIRSLQTNSPLWKLRVNCLYYCRFVHSHHNAEDIALFPAIRASNADLERVVDKLEADHRTVSDHLDEVEAAADELIGEDAVDARARLVTALGNLESDLLAHLNYEEEAIGPAILEWERWPLG
jgi:iron-sulfur cluster repair protein YtfE (RIC family)